MKAFPTDRLGVIKDTRSISINEAQQDGMDLRDYFAAKALSGMISNKNWFGESMKWESVESMTNMYAHEAYIFANAMMKAREK